MEPHQVIRDPLAGRRRSVANYIQDSFEYATNNEMELYAIFQAVEHAPSQAHLSITTDSKLCVKLLTGQAKSRSNPRLTITCGELLGCFFRERDPHRF